MVPNVLSDGIVRPLANTMPARTRRAFNARSTFLPTNQDCSTYYIRAVVSASYVTRSIFRWNDDLLRPLAPGECYFCTCPLARKVVPSKNMPSPRPSALTSRK